VEQELVVELVELVAEPVELELELELVVEPVELGRELELVGLEQVDLEPVCNPTPSSYYYRKSLQCGDFLTFKSFDYA
jgi:hypothetical protein